MNVTETEDGPVCEHGTAVDVHCCNCHSGFLFDADSCVCVFDGDTVVTDTMRMAQAIQEYAEWCGGVHDDGCPGDDTCGCSGKWINDGITAAVDYLRALAASPAGAPPQEEP